MHSGSCQAPRRRLLDLVTVDPYVLDVVDSARLSVAHYQRYSKPWVENHVPHGLKYIYVRDHPEPTQKEQVNAKTYNSTEGYVPSME